MINSINVRLLTSLPLAAINSSGFVDKLIQPSHPDAFPRYRRWDLSRLKAALNKGISNIPGHQVKGHPITPKHSEQGAMTITKLGDRITQLEIGSTSKTRCPQINTARVIQVPGNSAANPATATTKATAATTDDEDNIPISILHSSQSKKGSTSAKPPSSETTPLAHTSNLQTPLVPIFFA